MQLFCPFQHHRPSIAQLLKYASLCEPEARTGSEALYRFTGKAYLVAGAPDLTETGARAQSLWKDWSQAPLSNSA